ncbi:MAG: hypothetical protein MI976_06440 [Pseudomonadales bacterium]|nr:hypothetical protein [Pseudomonadales bacterium]
MTKLAVTYSVIPSRSQSSSLHLQYDATSSDCMKSWVLFGGLENGSTAPCPWWINYQPAQSAPDFLNQQTSKIILNLIHGLTIKAVPEFVVGDGGTFFELEFWAGNHKVKYVWWNKLPEPWQDLDTLVTFLEGFIDAKRESTGPNR